MNPEIEELLQTNNSLRRDEIRSVVEQERRREKEQRRKAKRRERQDSSGPVEYRNRKVRRVDEIASAAGPPVKGLDLALLNQIREKLATDKIELGSAPSTCQETAALLSFLREPANSRPTRVAYSFETSMYVDHSDLPSSSIICEDPTDYFDRRMHPALVRALEEVFREGSTPSKASLALFRQQTDLLEVLPEASVGQDNPDSSSESEDIFSGVGAYSPQTRLQPLTDELMLD
ncbi:MAG: uncharacterized protein KVP18_000401 [Porospora cf. gigantea A]|uniref:uncharacterized protein n=1 Tax=Porospora cf. gigantea A TaxID=2853593 RepID=UPI00355A9EC6|nr:MAG: hypothetical protein KVP18_000401 [Porospora cf. gigantea A]